MRILPDLQIGLLNGWLLLIIYFLGLVLMVLTFPVKTRHKLFYETCLLTRGSSLVHHILRQDRCNCICRADDLHTATIQQAVFHCRDYHLPDRLHHRDDLSLDVSPDPCGGDGGRRLVPRITQSPMAGAGFYVHWYSCDNRSLVPVYPAGIPVHLLPLPNPAGGKSLPRVLW